MGEEMVPGLAESPVWRMMKSAWSYSCEPQTDTEETALAR